MYFSGHAPDAAGLVGVCLISGFLSLFCFLPMALVVVARFRSPPLGAPVDVLFHPPPTVLADCRSTFSDDPQLLLIASQCPRQRSSAESLPCSLGSLGHLLITGVSSSSWAISLSPFLFLSLPLSSLIYWSSFVTHLYFTLAH